MTAKFVSEFVERKMLDKNAPEITIIKFHQRSSGIDHRQVRREIPFLS